MNWHQQAAARINYLFRRYKAHIWSDDYITTGKMLCGAKNERVYVDKEHAHNPANNVCKKCLKALSQVGEGTPSTIGEKP